MTTSTRLRAPSLLLGVSGALILGACSSSPPTAATSVSTSSAPSSSPSASTPSPSPSASARVAAVAITIEDFTFTVPASVSPGATVMITNTDAESHTVTSKAGGFDVKVDGRGGVATLTAPRTAGTYTLTCDFHANMSGSLIVK